MEFEPASYPPNSFEEISAIQVLLGLLDLKRVRPEARFLDKVPNLDGSVELVDENQKPIGELKIQIKKIPAGRKSFDCPVKLIAYSTRISSPFILICVDVENRKAYWSHLTVSMPGLRKEQKTFSVTFRSVIDEIGNGFPYFERWAEDSRDYRRRISEFPDYEKFAEEEVGLGDIDFEERIFFQRFVDEMNILLDVDFPAIKNENFFDTWKLGVSIHSLEKDSFHFSIYSIPKGMNAPLVRFLPRSGKFPEIDLSRSVKASEENPVLIRLQGADNDARVVFWVKRSRFSNPEEQARSLVLDFVKTALKDRVFGVYGLKQSSEYLVWLARKFPKALGLPESDHYDLSDLDYGFSVYLPMWYSLMKRRIQAASATGGGAKKMSLGV